ncbi:MAG: leucyl aminopeptidase [Acidobacteriota bacterium]
MKLSISRGDLYSLKVDALAVGIFDDLDFSGLKDGAALAKQAARLRFKGSAGESFYAFDRAGSPAKDLVFVGLGARESYGPDEARKAAAAAVRRFGERFSRTASLALAIGEGTADAGEMAAAAAEAAVLTDHRFQKYLTGADRKVEGLAGLSIHAEKAPAALKDRIKAAEITARATAFARDLVTDPSETMTPEIVAKAARALGKEYGFTVKVLDEKKCREMGMGAYLAVARGSKVPPRFVHLSYRPARAKSHVAFVGKGVTYDSGGLSLKPTSSMVTMKADMSGAAAVLGAMKAVGELKPSVAVDGITALCENMPGGGAYRPGDVLKSMSGKTIEVLNTDAEGRLTLADALCYAQKLKPDAVIDLATLTGACVVALGPDIGGAMGNNQDLVSEVLAAAKHSGDELWPLPLPGQYKKFLKSRIADVANVSSVRWGGALTAGLFLQEFVDKDMPWVHLDIAGPSFREDDGVDSHHSEGTGAGVRTLIRFVQGRTR